MLINAMEMRVQNTYIYEQLIFDKIIQTSQWKKNFFSTVRGQLNIHMQKNEAGLLSHITHKNELKMNERPKLKAKIIKLSKKT